MNRYTFGVAVLVLLCSYTTNAQSQHSKKEQLSQSSTYQYYIYLNGINSKDDVRNLENSIQKKSGVTYFLGNRYPVRYFLLKSNKAITQSTFANWVGSKYQVLYYQEGEYANEGALMTGINLNKKKTVSKQD